MRYSFLITGVALQLADHLRNDAVQISDEGKVRDTDDGCLGVIIDGNDDVRALHAGKVLHRAGDTTAM